MTIFLFKHGFLTVKIQTIIVCSSVLKALEELTGLKARLASFTINSFKLFKKCLSQMKSDFMCHFDRKGDWMLLIVANFGCHGNLVYKSHLHFSFNHFETCIHIVVSPKTQTGLWMDGEVHLSKNKLLKENELIYNCHETEHKQYLVTPATELYRT